MSASALRDLDGFIGRTAGKTAPVQLRERAHAAHVALKLLHASREAVTPGVGPTLAAQVY